MGLFMVVERERSWPVYRGDERGRERDKEEEMRERKKMSGL